jgi:hypothetical protein
MNTTAPANLATLAPAICRALGFNSLHHWTASDFQTYPRSDGECTLTRADGLALYVVAGGYGKAGRITITHSRPRGVKGEWVELWGEGAAKINSPEITVAATADAERIAKEIARRLLPDAECVQGLAMARIDADRAYRDSRLALLRAICEAAGEPVPGEHRHNREQVYSVDIYASDAARKEYSPIARAEVRGGYAEIKVDAKPGQAEALIAFLRSPAYLNAGTV